MPRLRELRISNLLSFGADGGAPADDLDAVLVVGEPTNEVAPRVPSVELGGLNVLIGANASGKSNLIDVLSLLQSLPTDLTETVREGGGVTEWMWKGPGGRERPAELEVRVEGDRGPIRHRLSFAPRGARLAVADERIEDWDPVPGQKRPYLYFGFENGRPMFNVRGGKARRLAREDLRDDQSVLAQRNDPDQYPELAYLRSFYMGFRVYRDWTTGRRSELRLPQPADLPDDFLLPSGKNLAIMLNAFDRFPKEADALRDAMRRFHPRFQEIKTIVQGGMVQLFFREAGLDELVPATRLSDGTLRYLALLTVLLHPKPPPMVCIEEPELGLHPDLIDDLASHILRASERTQIVATTHSDHLVSALSHTPDSVLVTERGPDGTRMTRLEAPRLEAWLQRFRLGELWMNGDLGGTRW